MHFKTKVFCTLTFTAMALASRLNSTEIVTTSYAAWQATMTGAPVEGTFTGITGTSYSTPAGFSLPVGSYGPLTVTGPDAGGYSLTGNTSYTYNAGNGRTYTLQTLQGASDGIGTMTFTTPSAGLTAFLLGIGMLGNSATPVTVTLSDGETFTANPAINGSAFLGLSSATPITSFTLSTSSGSAIELTDFFAGNSNQPAQATAPAAEVTTALMIGSGLLVLGARRRIFSNFSRTRTTT